MKAFILRLGIVATGLALAASPALAQRPSGGASSGGDRAVERGGGGGGAPSSGGGSVSTGNTGGGGGNVASSGGGGGSVATSSPSTAAAASSSVRASSNARESAPQHRTGSASSSGQSAAPRSAPASRQPASANAGSASRGVGSSNTAQAVPRNATASQPSSSNTASDGVPAWSRPRGNRPATDTAVARTVPVVRGGTSAYFYDPFYIDPYYGYGGNGYGIGYYGLNGSPYYYPGFGMGYGFGMGLGWYPYFGDPNGDYMGGGGTEGTGSYASQGVYGSHEQGNLKLKVKPRDAKVYVDGYFVGIVDQFDGLMQKLALNGGHHKVEIKADGYETAEFDVLINPQQTVTFEGVLKKLQ